MRIRPKLILVIILIHAFQAYGREPLKIVFWNVENLFDLKDDKHTNDNEYILGGRKGVTEEIYQQKLANLAEVVNALDAGVLGLCEIENRFVLEELNRAAEVRDYTIVHYDSPDRRGIDVALLVDPEEMLVLESLPVNVMLPTGNPTRDILYVKGTRDGIALHLFVNHWPSKYGGAERSIPLRAAAAGTLRERVEKIMMEDSLAEIVIMGDLNDEPIDPSVKIHLGAHMDNDSVGTAPYILWNTMGPWHRNSAGSTYKYAGKDMVYDHLIISPGLLDKRGLVIINGSVGVFDGEKYRQHGGKYDGYPFRFWAGNRLLGGYSDHMPVYLSVEKAD
ncbi:MAG TPA: endonuclease/exonuclease/phosphatase family protein [Candidatus Marinimicrobia bacterium]|nr:endonuclease/exonuclease/phosphatase family protein [Candidatus Neomarinimicrobiota bacterium]